jgi:hypothetical protein
MAADEWISLPTTFPESAGDEVAVLRRDHNRWVVIVLGAHPSRWLVAVDDGEGRAGSAAIELVASAS